MKNVMVFSCGSLPAIDINFALRGNKEYRVYGASSYDDHGIYIYENYIGNVPFIFESDFLPRFNRILDEYQIDFIIPLHESMILFFQEHIDEIHATVISSCYKTSELCRFKSKTYKALEMFDFIPKTYTVNQVDSLPVFIKKDEDQGARNAYKVTDRETLNVYGNMPGMLICEYLPDEEVTVDCFTDRHGTLRFCNPRVSDRILAGIAVHARRLQNNEEISDIAQKINSAISFRGPWFFQVKKDVNGKFKLLEIASRFAAAFSISRCMDINLPLMAIRDFDGKDVDFSYNDIAIEADKALFGRYTMDCGYSRVFLDDAAVFFNNTGIDSMVMMYLYQCVNNNRKIVLLTNEVNRCLAQLREARIAKDLFSSIQLITSEELTELNFSDSIFISRNEQNRATLRKEKNILCFEPTIIEALLIWNG